MAPRPKKARVCDCPCKCEAFKPTRFPMKTLEKIILEMDELEALRHCDLEGLTQEDAGKKMQVSRGTVQRLVTSARFKVTRALVENCALVMAGNYAAGMDLDDPTDCTHCDKCKK